MKTLRTLAVLVVIGAVALVLAGCSSEKSADSAATAEELFAEGIAYLQDSMADVNMEEPPWEWSVDMAKANGYFEDALDADPDYCGALLMAALTRLAMLIQDPDLVDIIEGLIPEEGRGSGSPAEFLSHTFSKREFFGIAGRLAASGREDLPFSELQDFIEDEVLPALDEVDSYLVRFEDQDCVVVLEIEVEERREAVEFEIDAADVYLIHASLDMIQSVFHTFVSYNVDIEPGQSFEELIDEDPDFLSLRPGDHMPSAYDELAEMGVHLDNCASSLAGETDPQDNDLFTDTDDEGWVPMGAGFAETLAEIAEDIEDGLQSGVTFNLAEDFGDPEAPDFDILVDLGEFLTDPLDPITDVFPAHTWRDSMSMDVTRPLDFADPTFSEVTPGMTDGNWEDIAAWIEGQ